jgi:predicted ferric reductase
MAKIKRLSNNLGLVSVLVLSFFPALLWLSTQSIAIKFSNSSLALTSLGQITGLIGMAMISVAIILSARTAFMDKLFNGLDNLYKIHRGIGIVSFIFLLIHPLTLALSYMPFSEQSAALFFLPGPDLAKNLGILALLLMMILLIITAFAKIKYQVLKFSHKFFGAVFIFSVLHTLFVQSDVSRNVFIHWYMLGLMAAGLVAFSYKTLLGKILVEKYIYSVKEVNQMQCKTTEIVMAPVGKRMEYSPGQFIFVSFSGANIGSEQHPFSIASTPFEPELRIMVKALGDYTSQISKLPVGTRAEIEGPSGVFNYSKAKSKNQIWIAGGAGIAPFIGMARDLKNAKGYNIDLYYCAGTKKDIISIDELSKITAPSGSFRFIPFCQDEKGYLDAEKIIKTSGMLEGKDIFFCGPPPMVKNLKGQLKKIKIPENKIHSEEFEML